MFSLTTEKVLTICCRTVFFPVKNLSERIVRLERDTWTSRFCSGIYFFILRCTKSWRSAVSRRPSAAPDRPLNSMAGGFKWHSGKGCVFVEARHRWRILLDRASRMEPKQKDWSVSTRARLGKILRRRASKALGLSAMLTR